MKPLPLHFLKNTIFKLLPASLIYEQGGLLNILLFSSRRGGSTHLAEMIAAESGMRFIDQPFDLRRTNTVRGQIKLRHLPPAPMSQFISLSGAEAQVVEKYIALILNGGLRGLSAPRFSKKDRTVLKIVNASPLLDWLAEHFPVTVVYLLRHPIAQGLSVLRNGWDNTAEAFLKNDFFVRSFMTVSQQRNGMRILEHGSELEKAVLNWCLENLVPLKHAKRVNLVVTYEELVLQDQAMIQLFSERLDLHNLDGMQRRPKVPSASSGFSSESTIRAIASDNKVFLINKWMSSLSEAEKNAIQDVLDMFGIDEYKAGSSLPHSRLLHFPTEAGQTAPITLAEIPAK